MKWVQARANKPIDGVDVHVVTESGKRGTARYWPVIGKWLSGDCHLSRADTVVKWKYEDAKTPYKHTQPYPDQQ